MQLFSSSGGKLAGCNFRHSTSACSMAHTFSVRIITAYIYLSETTPEDTAPIKKPAIYVVETN